MEKNSFIPWEALFLVGRWVDKHEMDPLLELRSSCQEQLVAADSQIKALEEAPLCRWRIGNIDDGHGFEWLMLVDS